MDGLTNLEAAVRAGKITPTNDKQRAEVNAAPYRIRHIPNPQDPCGFAPAFEIVHHTYGAHEGTTFSGDAIAQAVCGCMNEAHAEGVRLGLADGKSAADKGLVEAAEMRIDASEMDVYAFKAKYKRKEQADKTTWGLVSDRTLRAALAAFRSKP